MSNLHGSRVSYCSTLCSDSKVQRFYSIIGFSMLHVQDQVLLLMVDGRLSAHSCWQVAHSS
jgi:hypothetical protein